MFGGVSHPRPLRTSLSATPPTYVGPPHKSSAPSWRGPSQGEFTPNAVPKSFHTLSNHFPTIKAALLDPFSVPPDLPRVSPSQPQSPPPPADDHLPSDPAAPAPAPAPAELSSSSSSPSASISVSSEEQEAWRGEYDAQVVEWRRQSGDARARAEAGRARWEERRAREREEQQALQRQRQMQGEIPRADTDNASVSVSASAESPSTSTGEWEAVSVGTTQQSAASVLIPSLSTSTGPDASGGENDASTHSHSQQEGSPHTQVTSFFFYPSSPFVLMNMYCATF